MGDKVIITVFLFMFISFWIAGILRLRMFEIKSKVVYCLVFLFPIFIFYLNLSTFLLTKNKAISQMTILRRIWIVFFMSIVKLPICFGLTCYAMNKFEKECENIRKEKPVNLIKRGLEEERGIYAKTILSKLPLPSLA